MSELPCDCCDGCTDRVYLACEYCESIINASKRLSPAVRDLLLTNPEAVEKAVVDSQSEITICGLSLECVAACVEAVRADKARRHHDMRCAENQCEVCGVLCHSAAISIIAAIALLPKEENQG